MALAAVPASLNALSGEPVQGLLPAVIGSSAGTLMIAPVSPLLLAASGASSDPVTGTGVPMGALVSSLAQAQAGRRSGRRGVRLVRVARGNSARGHPRDVLVRAQAELSAIAAWTLSVSILAAYQADALLSQATGADVPALVLVEPTVATLSSNAAAADGYVLLVASVALDADDTAAASLLVALTTTVPLATAVMLAASVTSVQASLSVLQALATGAGTFVLPAVAFTGILEELQKIVAELMPVPTSAPNKTPAPGQARPPPSGIMTPQA